VLELLLDIAHSDGQQDSPFGAALLVGVPVMRAFPIVSTFAIAGSEQSMI
jgi:hypothetical protein